MAHRLLLQTVSRRSPPHYPMNRVTYAAFPSPLGTLTGFSQNGAITALWLPTRQFTIPANAAAQETPELITLGKWLERYFRGENPEVNFRLSPDGTAFQRQVWDLLRTIPYGTSITYGQLARHMSPSMSAQAVGQAVGKNPIPIVIPCHRILGAHGKLTGYSAGLPSKVQLLELEGISYT